MAVNADKPERWKEDIATSVDFYNDWFMQFAPRTYRDARVRTTQQVTSALALTGNLTRTTPSVLRHHPEVLKVLRMATAPPIARDRLIGLAGVSANLVKSMEEKNRIPPGMCQADAQRELGEIGRVFARLADVDIFPWLENKEEPARKQIHRAATIVADRLCGAVSAPIIRNEQEHRQLGAIGKWLESRKYTPAESSRGIKFDQMSPGSFSFHVNIPAELENGRVVNIPVDVVIMPLNSKRGDFPLLIEAKSAGDYTNTNKRRKEEAIKIAQLRRSYGKQVRFVLFLCGYFDSGYLGYEAAEGIDWVWEHRIDNLSSCGL